ncbi:MAG: tetratricopeptide repeat protein [Deltaproteobacteria bacterium]|nr:tetratricopeptide repeat protein [Deltaproteobacteria bacterium]
MKIMKKALCALCLLLFTGEAYAGNEGASTEELFSLSNLAYMDGRYDEAIKGYKKMINKGIINPDVYYNLGNAYVKTGEGGYALLNYEKSLELSPGSEDVEYNLSLVKEQLSLTDPSIDASAPWEGIAGIITFARSADLTLFFYIVLFILFSAMLLTGDENRRLKLKKAGTLFTFAALILAAIASYELFRQESLNKGIIVGGKAELYEVPMAQGTPQVEINEGVKVSILASDKQWFKVSTPGGLVGWVSAERVGVI